MAIYRNVQLSFWTDNKVEDDFTPEDKYFYIYLLTNPQTNICGCYEISYSQTVRQTGYNKDTILRLLDRFDTVHNMVRFSKETKEVLILNWYKYNWSKSEKTLAGVENVMKHIKCEEFKEYVGELVQCFRNDELILNNKVLFKEKSDKDKQNEDNEIFRRIISYLNEKCNTRYRPTSKETLRLIRLRMREGFTEEDFRIVIDKKSKDWKGMEYEKFLRPETLFGDKFESYLNQNIVKTEKKYKTENLNNFERRNYDMDNLEKKLLNSR